MSFIDRFTFQIFDELITFTFILFIYIQKSQYFLLKFYLAILKWVKFIKFPWFVTKISMNRIPSQNEMRCIKYMWQATRK